MSEADPRPERPRRRVDRRRASVLLGVAVLLGLAAGALWAALGDPLASAGQPAEAVAAYDVLFTGLALVGGLLVGIAGLTVPAGPPLLRYGLAMGGGLVAGLIAWGAGDLLGSPGLQAKGAVVLWPLLVSVVFFARYLTSLVRHGDEEQRRYRPTGAPPQPPPPG